MNENAFSYTYSATCNQEVMNIRKKYLPKEETKLEELKRLDHLVQNSGVMEALIIGVVGCLVFATDNAPSLKQCMSIKEDSIKKVSAAIQKLIIICQNWLDITDSEFVLDPDCYVIV